MVLPRIRSLLTFFTRLPVGYADIEMTAKNYHHVVLVVGGVLGILGYTISWILQLIVPNTWVPGVLGLTSIYLITGFHHLDGLLDLGDALMASKNREERIKILHDVAKGTGAVATGVIVLTISFLSAMSLGNNVPIALALSAIGSLWGGIIVSYLGPPSSYPGLGRLFITSLREKQYKIIISLIETIALTLVFAWPRLWLALIAFSTATVTGILVNAIARYSLGMVNGDVIGASIEITRTTTLLILAIKTLSPSF